MERRATSQAFAWRIPFLIGGVFGFLAVFLRRLLAETPVFEEMRRRAQLVEGLPLRVVLAGHGRAVVISMLLTWVLTAAIVVVILMTPTLIQKLFAIAAADTLAANSVATLGLSIGCVVFGLLADRFGAERMLMLGCALLLVATYALYLGLGQSPQYLDASLRDRRLLRRRRRRDPDRARARVPAAGAIFRHLVRVQRRLCDFRRADAAFRDAADEEPAARAGALRRGALRARRRDRRLDRGDRRRALARGLRARPDETRTRLERAPHRIQMPPATDPCSCRRTSPAPPTGAFRP